MQLMNDELICQRWPPLGAAANRIGANGGWSTRAIPGTIAGTDGSWSAANPQGAVAGILGVRGGYGSSGWSQFLRRDGTLPMTGNLDMGTQSINNANAVNSVTLATTGGATVGGNLGVSGATTTNGITNAGAINTTTLATTGGATVGGNLGVTGATTTNGITNTGAINTTTIATTGSATIGGALSVAGATTTNGITNTGNISTTGDISTGRLVLNTTVSTGTTCTGLNGYQARIATGSLVSCVSGTWTAPGGSGGSPPAACGAQTVGGWSNSGGSGGSCYGTTSTTTSGLSLTVTATSGGTGSASYLCTNGTWSWQSGGCVATPPPACITQSVAWGSGCAGTATSVASGGSSSVTATTGTGSATFLCSSGSFIYQSGTCTASSVCPAQTITWSQNQSTWQGNTDMGGTYNCSAPVTSKASGSIVALTNTKVGNTGSATATCQANGTWNTSGATCDGSTKTAQSPLELSTSYPSGNYPNCNSSAQVSLVAGWYGTYLYRKPDDSGLNYHCLLINSNSQAASLSDLQNSSEAQMVNGYFPKHVDYTAEGNICGNNYGLPWTVSLQVNTCKRYPN